MDKMEIHFNSLDIWLRNVFITLEVDEWVALYSSPDGFVEVVVAVWVTKVIVSELQFLDIWFFIIGTKQYRD